MKDITNNEMQFILRVIKTPEEAFNARSIARHLQISHMGAHKIAKKLEKEGILSSKQIGKGIYYRLTNKEYVHNYLKFLLQREVEQASPYIKRWANELKKIKHAEGIILFGSVLRKEDEANDIDALILVNQSKFSLIKKEIEELDIINDKKIHPIYQSKLDLENNINKRDKVVLNAIKGLIVSGEDCLIKILQNESR